MASSFELPDDFQPSALLHRHHKHMSANEFNEKFDYLRKNEVNRLNNIGTQISDYLALIQSGNFELSDYEALLLAMELYKVEVLQDLNIDTTEKKRNT